MLGYMEVQQQSDYHWHGAPIVQDDLRNEEYLEESRRQFGIQNDSNYSSSPWCNSSDATVPKVKLSKNDCIYIGETLGKALSCSLAEVTMKRPNHPVALLAHYLLVFKYEAKFEHLKKEDIEHLARMREQHFIHENHVRRKLEEFKEEEKHLEGQMKNINASRNFIFKFFGEVTLRKGQRIPTLVNKICERLIVSTRKCSLIEKIRKDYILKDLENMMVTLRNDVFMETISIAEYEITAFYKSIMNVLKPLFPKLGARYNVERVREEFLKVNGENIYPPVVPVHTVSDTELYKLKIGLSDGYIPTSAMYLYIKKDPCMRDCKDPFIQCQLVNYEDTNTDIDDELSFVRTAPRNKSEETVLNERTAKVEAIRRMYCDPWGVNQAKNRSFIINDVSQKEVSYIRIKVSEIIQEMKTHIYEIRVSQLDHIKEELSNVLKNLLEELYDIRLLDKSEDIDFLEEEVIPLLNSILNFQHQDDKFVATRKVIDYIECVLEKQKEDMKRAEDEDKVTADKQIRNLLDSYYTASVISGRSINQLLLEHEQNRCTCALENSSLNWIDDKEEEIKAAIKIEFENILMEIISDIDGIRINKNVLMNIELIINVLVENGAKYKQELFYQILSDILCLQRLCVDLFIEEQSTSNVMDSIMPRGRPCACLYIQHVVSMLVEIFDSQKKKHSVRREKEKKELQCEIIKMFNNMVATT